MNQQLKAIQDLIQQNQQLNPQEKEALLKSLKDADKNFSITEFKLDRTEKVKRTTAILLEETIEELEQKRKAVESQNRELEIEAALERVRTVAMSMNKADDLLSICETMFNELKKLGFDELRNAMIDIHYDDENYLLNYDYSDDAGGTVTRFIYKSHPIVDNLIYHSQQSKESFTEMIYSGKDLEEWKIFRKNNGEKDDARLDNIEALYYYFYSIGTGAIGISMFKVAHAEQLNILKRFRNVFDLAYKRYVDITNAEAQAREARIESALERVRAIAMAMKNSEELITICEVMFNELKALGLHNIRNAQIAIENDARQSYIFYVYSDFEKITAGEVGYNSSPVTQRLYNELGKSGGGLYEREYSPEEMIEWRSWRKSLSPLLDEREETVASLCWYMYSIGKGNIGISTFNTITKEQVEIVKRFKKVFELSYTRFDDLQKAEAQAREAQIESALEKVRSRSLAMHQTSELQEVIQTVHKELLNLNLSIYGGSFVVINDDVGEELRCWGAGGTANTSEEVLVPHFNMTFCTNLIKGIKGEPGFFTEEFSQEDKKKYFTKIFEQKPWSNLTDEQKNKIISGHGGYTRSVAVSKYTTIFIINEHGQKFSDADNDIVNRFAKVFEQAFVRFLDIKKAEAQSRENQIQLALERVRARTMAMQKSDELAETAALLFSQFKELGNKPDRITIGIMQEEKQLLELWATNGEAGEPREFYRLPFSEPHVLAKCVKAWKEQEKSLVLSLGGKPLEEYTEFWRSVVAPQGAANAFEQVIFNFAFFSKGYLGFISFEQVPTQTIEILERFAGVFDLTYTRFLDLEKAEAQTREAEKNLFEIKAARKKAEDALSELQVTQRQLIQSEKMASLGELTAGIAHEIQNPLNFVNNFSEVNKELISELVDEVDKKNFDEVKLIANDIKDNEEKINHHGKRADAIVKGMLQHSRQTKSIKELTDINALCDEYLRLSYHGLRAKDKSFNADFKTDFDETINKINIVPQDIGRVLLNLFNNAFYAVYEKKKSYKLSAMSYEPLVSVQTKKINDVIEIKVEDNGNGIASNIIDKIFQPFFTTKPTGQGTGLGLSLAYDIITKQHNGTLKVESKEGEGSNFIIQLPAN